LIFFNFFQTIYEKTVIMANENKDLQKLIREALSNPVFKDLISEEEGNLNTTWWQFEHFGIEVLKQAGYGGSNIREPVYAAKKAVEKIGWRFADESYTD
jgi:hypothetical protein